MPAGRSHPSSISPGFEFPAGAQGCAGSRHSLPRIVSPLPPALLREEVAQLQEEVHLLRQMKEMLTKDLEETHGSKSPEVLSATELKVQLAQKEQELARAKEALQGKGCASLCCTSPQHPKLSRKLINEERKSRPFSLGLCKSAFIRSSWQGFSVPGTPLLSWISKGWCGAGKDWGAVLGCVRV